MMTQKGDPCISNCSVLYLEYKSDVLNFVTAKYSLH